jgi:prepilin-type N-terminal cleavage/methylation domain-containing protein
MISVISTIKKAGFMSKNKDMREAFTFIELLLVVTIAAVLAAMVVPNLKITHSNLQLDNFVKDIYYLAKYLQISSVSQSCIYRLDIVQTNR